jgi:hypothetical protein
MGLTRAERETVINFNEEENFATIYTASQPMINKCIKAGYEKIKEYVNSGEVIAMTFKLPKGFVSLRTKKREYSQETREKMVNRMKRTNEITKG